MSCQGCRVLRKGCGDNCVLRSCLEWIESPEAQGHATLFLSKFFGRSDLINFISAIPSGRHRTALFQSLLYEAVGRTVNPVHGAMGLLSTGNWHLCEAAVQTVLAGGTPTAVADEILIPEVDERSDEFQVGGAWSTMMIPTPTYAGNNDSVPPTNVMIADERHRDYPLMPASGIAADVPVSSRHNDGDELKLLNLFE